MLTWQTNMIIYANTYSKCSNNKEFITSMINYQAKKNPATTIAPRPNFNAIIPVTLLGEAFVGIILLHLFVVQHFPLHDDRDFVLRNFFLISLQVPSESGQY